MVIYKLTNKVNGKVYIGQTVRDFSSYVENHRRWAFNAPQSDRAIHRAIRKHGWEAFSREIIEEGFSTQEELNAAEIRHIAEHGAFHSGYNMTLGGGGTSGYKGIGRYGVDNPFYGRKWGDKHPRLGATLSEESRELIRCNHADCTGKANSRAKHWEIKSPDGVVYRILGTLRAFCEVHGLSKYYLKQFEGSIVPESGGRRNTKFDKAQRTVGWGLFPVVLHPYHLFGGGEDMFYLHSVVFE